MEKSAMVVGIDDSEHSFHALEWTLEHFFSPAPENSAFKLVVVHAKPSAMTAVGLTGPGAAEVLPYVERDLKIIATRVLEKSKEICAAKSINDVIVEAIEGDPRNVLCDAVDRHNASLLVVGSHGYGAIKSVNKTAVNLLIEIKKPGPWLVPTPKDQAVGPSPFGSMGLGWMDSLTPPMSKFCSMLLPSF